MSNSPLVSYTRLSPNHSGLRTQKIDTITPHCIVGHLSLQTLGNIFAQTSRRASSNYGIDDQGRIGMFVEEKNRSWCTSSNANDQRGVTIEIASDVNSPYKITDGAMRGLITLAADICKRNDIPKLLWRADKSLIGKVTQQNITIHRWFSNTACPGDYIVSQLGYVADEVNKLLLPKTIVSKPTPSIPLAGAEYLVKIKVTSLNYRSGPGTNNPIRGLVYKDQVYTIIEEAYGLGASKWGKLKSGAGWISLDHCVRM